MSEAVDIARDLVGDEVSAGTPVPAPTELARRFAATEFDVPSGQDADGYLFQYGEVNWLPEPTFVLSMVRQLEVVDTNGEHESYTQVKFDYRYFLDGEPEMTGSHSERWFPDGGTPLDSWLDFVSRSPIGDVLRAKKTTRISGLGGSILNVPEWRQAREPRVA